MLRRYICLTLGLNNGAIGKNEILGCHLNRLENDA